MTREQKTAVIEELASQFQDSKYFYITDTSELTVEKTNQLRRKCFESNIQMKVVKNTLIRKALERAADANEENYTEIYSALKGFSAVMFTETGNVPAKLIKEFRKENGKPLLKAAFIDSSVYIGDDQVEALTQIKSKEELLGEIIGLLESPIKNVMGALQSGGNTITGLLKALEERESA
ncbi:ribosomal protein L10 [Saprospira grandis DSM 2844]|uniref:Large ribosomal subunit protein uL10 n=1 Tax=Saprospira grandis DSM 2844 TaxID=694433 RepID=J1I2S3_9BACT|nr:50S ribosomal protein L10 [Saprospira grandis]EJF53010.1 ribosomal protein L10 [Saprospira grandis DSM 2844]